VGFIADLIREKRSIEMFSLKNIPDKLLHIFGAQPTAAGKDVSAMSAMSLTSVYACIRIIAWTLASMPIITYKTLTPRGKERDKDYYLYKLLHDRPNPEQTTFEWVSLTSAHQNLWGAGISEIEFDRDGVPVALWPLPPWTVTPKRTAKNNLIYEVSVDGTIKHLWPYQVFCVQTLTTSRTQWVSPIQLHRETIGAALAVREFGARTFGQGTNPAGIVTTEQKLTKDSEDSLKTRLSGYAGLGNSHRLMLLDNGLQYKAVGLPPEDAQYLQTRQFDIAEIARIYNVPLFLLQDHEKSTSWGTGIEEMNSGFVTYTINPYTVQWQQQFRSKLIFDDIHYVEFLLDSLLRAKLEDRYKAYAIARQWGWMSPDDVCEIENRNPLPDGQGEKYLVPMNMVDAKLAGVDPKPIPKEDPNEDPSAKQGGK